MRPQEWNRRLLHVAPGVFPYLYHFFPQADPLQSWSLWVVTGTCAAGAAGALGFARWFRRRGEHDWAVSVLSYVLIVLLLVWLFPDRTEIACGVVCIIAFGDGFASLVGILVGGPRLPWNAAKSWAGSAAFVAGSLPLSALAFWLQSDPAITPANALACVAPAVGLGVVVESLPLPINDNICVGLIAGTALIATDVLVVVQ
jgi:dolichol kinase